MAKCVDCGKELPGDVKYCTCGAEQFQDERAVEEPLPGLAEPPADFDEPLPAFEESPPSFDEPLPAFDEAEAAIEQLAALDPKPEPKAFTVNLSREDREEPEPEYAPEPPEEEREEEPVSAPAPIPAPKPKKSSGGARFIEFRNVSKTYVMGEVTIKAVDGADFAIEEGELALIVGSSGAGKTTVLNILGGMDSADADGGEVWVDGKEITRLSSRKLTEYRRNQVGFVFQFYNLIPNLTALENLEIATQLSERPLPPLEVLRQVGLEERTKNFPAQLSGGEQQRVSIARALAKNPRLLLCDEPTGALDYATGKQILSLLQRTCRESGMTVIIITHNTAIEPIADRVIRMRSGKISQVTLNRGPKDVAELDW